MYGNVAEKIICGCPGQCDGFGRKMNKCAYAGMVLWIENDTNTMQIAWGENYVRVGWII